MERTFSSGYEQYIHQNRHRNFIFNMLEMSFWTLAMSFVFSSTILPLYASYLTRSTVLIGLVVAINEVAFFLPQLLSARRIEQLSVKTPFVVRVTLMERLPLFFVAVPIFLWPRAPKPLAYAVLAFSLALAQGSGGYAAPAWKGMLGKIILPDRRGLLFSLGSAIGGLLGIAGALLSRYFLSHYSYPVSFGICFLLAGVANTLSWSFMFGIREPVRQPQIESLPFLDYLKMLPQVLRDNTNFSKYLLSQFFIIFGAMGMGFYAVYARYTFETDDAFVANLTVVALITQSAGIPFLGWLSDRLGHKWLSKMTAVLGCAAAVLIALAPGKRWMYAVFILANLSRESLIVSRDSITMEFCSPERLPTFTALANTIIAAPLLLAPICGGWLIGLVGYRITFIMSAALFIGGWIVLHLGVRDPRKQN